MRDRRIFVYRSRFRSYNSKAWSKPRNHSRRERSPSRMRRRQHRSNARPIPGRKHRAVDFVRSRWLPSSSLGCSTEGCQPPHARLCCDPGAGGQVIMGGTGIIDQFLETFTRYIDSGFGLLGGEVGYLAAALAAIDVTLAGLFWAWGADEDIIARLVRKTLFVGVFAFLISNWNSLARTIFESFASLGLKASGTGLSSADFLRPGKIAQVGLDAGRPILDSISGLMGYVSFFENFIQIAVLLFAWIVVLLAFFILAIQLFITLIEFKLTTLAGFVLIPFGLFGKTAFAAERVLGNVISSGVKVLVLAVIIGIGSTLFSQFTQGFGGNQPTIEDALSLVLAALSLLGLGIFGPGIATGLVSGGPQPGAGALLSSTALAARGGATMAGGAATAYGLAAASSGETGLRRVGAGMAGAA